MLFAVCCSQGCEVCQGLCTFCTHFARMHFVVHICQEAQYLVIYLVFKLFQNTKPVKIKQV